MKTRGRNIAERADVTGKFVGDESFNLSLVPRFYSSYMTQFFFDGGSGGGGRPRRLESKGWKTKFYASARYRHDEKGNKAHGKKFRNRLGNEVEVCILACYHACFSAFRKMYSNELEPTLEYFSPLERSKLKLDFSQVIPIRCGLLCPRPPYTLSCCKHFNRRSFASTRRSSRAASLPTNRLMYYSTAPNKLFQVPLNFKINSFSLTLA